MPHGHSTLKQGCLVARVVGKGGHMGVEVGGVSVDVTQNLVFEENLASLALKLVDHNQTHCAVPSLSKPPTHPCMHTFKCCGDRQTDRQTDAGRRRGTP